MRGLAQREPGPGGAHAAAGGADADPVGRLRPAHAARGRRERRGADPRRALVTVPFTGHSVVTSDLSGTDCAKNAIASFFAGTPIAQCAAAPQTIPPSRIAPTRLSRVRGRTKALKTVAAVSATVRDVRLQFLGDEIAVGRATPSGAKVAGLRSGHATATSSGYNLRRVEFVPGVTVNGFVPARPGHHDAHHQRALGSARQADLPSQRHRHGPSGRAQGLGVGRPRGERRDAAAGREAAEVPQAPTVGLMPNALARETCPYLLQHRDNPVDWLPWGDEALARARELDRPLLVSIGYSSCHWCHVMERESFEDPETAALMNERFVCVKVDREERPDVDALYMEAVQAMTGHGGWPLNVFLTPEQAPFYGGTYFPPEPRHGDAELAPGAGRGGRGVGRPQREEIRAQGAQVAPRLSGGALLTPVRAAARCRARSTTPSPSCARASTASTAAWAARRSSRRPRSSSSCSRAASSAMALQTLRSMAGGGIYDQVGGGFARYSVDARWTVPHFEKMLYDNALLARAYLHGWQASGDARAAPHAPRRRSTGRCARCAPPRAASTARSTPTPRASRASSTSGRVDELRAALGDDADAAIAWFGASERGNFEGDERPRVARAPSRRPSSASGSARGCSRSAPSACAPASTTSA